MLSNVTLIKDKVIPVPKKSIYSLYIKRIMDIALSGFALLVISPVLVLLAVLELAIHGRPIFYVSQRPGKNCELFNIYKFRSMTNKTDENDELLPEEFRLTKFGLFLRRTSLDELPEIWSIFTGKMSIVGPRPLLTEYVELYTPRHKMRHNVRPGLECARVKRSKSDVIPDTWTWRDQFENDIYYIENISFLLDVRIIIGIAVKAIKGSSFRTNDTRVRFNGKNLDDTRSKQEAMAEIQNKDKQMTVNLN